MNKYLYVVVIVLVLLAGMASYIFFNSRMEHSATSQSPTDIYGNKLASQYTIEMTSYSFSPDRMLAEPGKNLIVTLVSKTGNHRLMIADLNFDSGQINEGQSKTVSIPIPTSAKSEYSFSCDTTDNKEGKLVIRTL